MSTLSGLTPGQILKAIRAEDMQVISSLAYLGCEVEKIWTQTELAEMFDKNVSTISRWVALGRKNANAK